MKIKTVRFCEDIMMGTEMEHRKAFSEGDYFHGKNVHLEVYDLIFLRIDFVHPETKKTFSQLTPWNRVDAVLFEEDQDTKPVSAE